MRAVYIILLFLSDSVSLIQKEKAHRDKEHHELNPNDLEHFYSIIEKAIEKENKKLNRSDDTANDEDDSKIFSASFGLLSSTLGVVAKTVRITGDTTAGALGSSIKLVGVAVKSVGYRLNGAGKQVGSRQINHDDNKLANETQNESKDGRNRDRFNKLHPRIVTSRGINLMGNIVQQVGDLLLFTGSATESIASVAVALTEESVQKVESITSYIAQTSSPGHSKKKILVRPSQYPPFEQEDHSIPINHEELSSFQQRGERSHQKKQITSKNYLRSFLDLLTSEIAGIPSQALELFIIFSFSFIGTIFIIRPKQGMGDIPFRTYILLLLIFLLAWLQTCYLSQLRSRTVYSVAESNGVHSTLSSLQGVDSSMQETAVWLNTLLQQLWRVPSPHCPSYPDYVRIAMKACGNEQSIDCIVDASCTSYGGLEPFLSWKIGRAITNALDNQKAPQSQNAAFISLHSITLGSHPPLIRDIEILKGGEKRGTVDYLIHADLLLENFLLVLDIKFSKLEYAILPKFKISVESLITNLKFRIRLHQSPNPPFFSKLELSLENLPQLNLKINPLSEDSYQGNIDLGSIPWIRDLLQSKYRKILSAFLSPNYITADFKKLSKVIFEKYPSKAEAPNLDLHSIARPSSSLSQLRSKTDQKHMEELKITPEELGGDSINRRKHHTALIRPTTKVAKLGIELWVNATSS